MGENTKHIDPTWVHWCMEIFDGHVGNEFDFYGAAERQFKLNEAVWEAIEDPSDGYRSHLDTVLVKPDSQTIFFQTPIARVKLTREQGRRDNEYGRECEVDFWHLVDVADGHVWLTFGTDNTDDYYPSFTFDYHPRLNGKPESMTRNKGLS